MLGRLLSRLLNSVDKPTASSPESVSQKRWSQAQEFEAGWWKQWLQEHPDGNDDQWLGYVAGQFGLDPRQAFDGEVVVDVGGGPLGLLTKLRADRRIVVDPQPIPSFDKGIERIQASGEAIPLPEGLADRVLFYNVLQHVRCPRDVLNECVRITKPGGRIYGLEQLHVPTDLGHPHTLTEAMFETWLAEAPLTLERQELTPDASFAGPDQPGEAILCLVATKHSATTT